MKFVFRLRWMGILLYLALISAWLATLGWLNHHEFEMLTTTWQEAGLEQTQLLAQVLAAPLAQNETAAVQGLMTNIIFPSTGTAMIVVDAQGALVAESNPATLTTDPIAISLAAKVWQSRQPIWDVQNTPYRLYYALPIKATQGQTLGILVAVLNREAEYQHIRQDTQNAWLGGMGFSLGGLALLLVALHKWLLVPIEKLYRFVQATESGRPVPRFSMPYTFLEVGELGRAFNQLLDTLDTQQTTLQNLNAHLEERVAERTTQLAAEVAAHQKAAAALQASETKLRTLFNILPVGVVVLDANDQVVEANPRITTVLDLSPVAMAQGQYRQRQYLWPDGTPMPVAELASARVRRQQTPIYDMEIGVVKEDGEPVWCAVSAALLPEAELVLVVLDITARKRAETQLAISETRFQALMENAPLLISAKDLTGTVMMANRRFDLLADFDAAAFVGKSVFELFPAPVAEALWQNDLAALQAGTALEFEETVAHKDGSWHTYHTIKFPLYNAAHQPFAVCAISNDITERNQVVAELQLHSQIVQNMAEGVHLVRATDGYIFYTNTTFDQMFGYAPGELVGQHVSRLNAPTVKDPATTATEIMQALQQHGVWHGELQNIRKDGTVFWCLASVTSFTHPSHGAVYLSIHQDITARKAAEDALRRSERNLNKAQQVAHVGSWVWHVPTGQVEWSDEMYRIFGIDKAGFSGRLADIVTDLVYPADRTAVNAINHHIEKGGPPQPLEYRVQHADGTVRTVWAEAGEHILDEHGQPLFLSGIVQDITERKQAEAALRASEAQYRNLFQNTLDVILLADDAGHYVDANPAASIVLGYTRAELCLRQIWDLTPTHSAPQGRAAWQTFLHSGKQQGEYQLFCKDGQLRDFEYVAVANILPGLHLSVLRDITERRRAEVRRAMLYAVLRDTNGELELEQIMAAAVKAIVARQRWSAVGLSLLEPDGQTWRTRASGGVGRSDPTKRHALTEGVIGRAYRTGEMQLVADVRADPDFFQGKNTITLSELAVPLKRGPQTIGVLNLESTEPNAFGPEDTSLAISLADIIQLALNNALLYQSAQQEIAERKQAEAALRESEALLRGFFESPGAMRGIVEIREADIFHVDDNAFACAFFGLPPGGTAQKFASAMGVPADAIRLWLEHYQTCRRLQQPVSFEYQHALPTHSRWFAPTVSFLGDFEYPRFAYVVHDITERKQAEASLKQHLAELQTLNVIAQIANRPLILGIMMRAMLIEIVETLGMAGGWVYLPPDDNPSHALQLVAHQGVSQGVIAAIKNLQQPTAWNTLPIPLSVALEKLRQQWETVAPCPTDIAGASIMVKGNFYGWVGVFSPHHEKLVPSKSRFLNTIAAQLGLAVENQRLARETAELEVLRESNRLRTALISNVSHELRTPLGIIITAATTLNEHEDRLVPSIRHEFINDIISEGQRLEHIVSDLLTLSRQQNQSALLVKHPVAIAQLIRATVQAMQSQTTRHQLQAHLPSLPLHVNANANQVEQVLRNLLTNAIKYSPQGGLITVRVQANPVEVVVSVTDQGIGIAPVNLERIFESFYRVENEQTQSLPGVGLGLAISQGIISAHGGRIWAESQLGQGSTFYFTLPLSFSAIT